MGGLARQAPPAATSVADAVRGLLAPTAPRDRRVWLLAGVLAAVAAAVALRGQRDVLYDDAAIYLRYAQRLATGHGWTYNDGDWTNGASSTLYTVLLAVAHRLGADLEVAARVLGALGYVGAVAVATVLGARLGGLVAGALAGGFLVLSIDFQAQSLAGLEVSLAATVGLLAILAVVDGRDVRAGLLVGLALLVKLDAGVLALAVGSSIAVVHRRLPVRTAAVAAALIGPWLLASIALFGTVLPSSATQKASGAVVNPGSGYSRSWMVDELARLGTAPLALVALGALVVAWRWRRRAPDRAAGALAVVLWGAGVLALYSLLDLGDAYSWYRAGLYPPIAVGAGVALAAAARAAGRLGPGAVAAVVLVAAAGLVAPQLAVDGGTSLGTLRSGHRLSDYERFEATRRDAGLWLGERARPGEVVATCWGWVAYGVPQSPILEHCPLNTRDPVDEPTWLVQSIFGDGPSPPVLGDDGAPLCPVVLEAEEGAGRSEVYRLDGEPIEGAEGCPSV